MSASRDSDVERLQRALEEAREVHRQWKQRFAERRRRVLDPDVVRAMLPHRLVTARAFAETAEARARHLDMERRSPAYRATIDALVHVEADLQVRLPLSSHMLRTTIDGVTWWVATPRPDAQAANERMLAKQTFPYRAMTQTRELGIGGIMLDLGANIGATSIPRVIAGDVTAVYCAEPDPLNFACLVRSVIDNGLQGLVLPDRVAITDTTGPVRLFQGKHSGGHTVIPAVGDGFAQAGAGAVVDVEGITLDAWVERLGLDLRLVTFVKVDTQGAEPQVLAGAARVLAHRHIAWQLEVSPDLLELAGSSVRDLLDRLRGSFTHFIDLSGRAPGDRVQPLAAAAEALAYLTAPGHTDLLVFSA